MTWTYSGDPVLAGDEDQQRDAVRFLANVKDADLDSAILDEEIAFALATEANVYMAAARIAELASSQPVSSGIVQSQTIGDLSITYGDSGRSAVDYMSLAASLRQRGRGYQLPSCGGLSRDEQTTARRDTDLPRRFYQGQFAEWPR